MAQAGAAYRNGLPAQTSGAVMRRTGERKVRSGGAAAQAQKARIVRFNRMMLRVTIVLIVASLFVYISRMAEISANAKEISRIRKEITQLNEEKQYLEVKLAARKDLDRVRDEATGRLGMGYPDEGSVRLISLSGYTSKMNTQTAHDNAAP